MNQEEFDDLIDRETCVQEAFLCPGFVNFGITEIPRKLSGGAVDKIIIDKSRAFVETLYCKSAYFGEGCMYLNSFIDAEGDLIFYCTYQAEALNKWKKKVKEVKERDVNIVVREE